MPDNNYQPADWILLTGYGRDADIRAAREAGFDAHITKPADPHLIDEVLTRPRQGPEGVVSQQPREENQTTRSSPA